MATFVEVAIDWAKCFKQPNGEAAILLKSNQALAYALSGIQSPHHFSTAIVSLLQSPVTLDRNCWIACSYPPTAACVGMASLLGVTRIVWPGQMGVRSIKLDRSAVTEQSNKEATVLQVDKKDYKLPQPLPGIKRWFPHYAHLLHNVFDTPDAARTLIGDLRGADDTAKDNAGLLIALAIANLAHGSLHNNPTRSLNFQGQNIASILVDRNYNILRWGLNTNADNSSLHGEVNLVRSHQGKSPLALPDGGKLFTTLEPCAMCSGMIVHCAGDGNDFKVVSAQKDEQVKFSYLRPQVTSDGYSGNRRSVQSSISSLPLLIGYACGGEKKQLTSINEYLQDSQLKHSPSPQQLMQTTKFLEQHAKPVLSDSVVLLNGMAALWLPSNERDAWRNKLHQLMDHVKTSVG